MTTPTTCSVCRQTAHRNARGELLPHTRPGPERFVRVQFGWQRVPTPVVCEAPRKGARA